MNLTFKSSRVSKNSMCGCSREKRSSPMRFGCFVLVRPTGTIRLPRKMVCPVWRSIGWRSKGRSSTSGHRLGTNFCSTILARDLATTVTAKRSSSSHRSRPRRAAIDAAIPSRAYAQPAADAKMLIASSASSKWRCKKACRLPTRCWLVTPRVLCSPGFLCLRRTTREAR